MPARRNNRSRASSERKRASSNRRRTSNNNRRRGRRILLPLLVILIFAVVGYFGYSFANPLLPVELEVGQVAVHFIDVGQGDAVLIQTADGHVLIDGGDNHMGERVVQYLRNAGVSELSYVIATHPHADHIGGLVDVLNTFPVNTLIMPNVAHTTRTFERFLDAIEYNNVPLGEPVAGSTLYVGDAVFTIIAPNSYGHANLNNYSVSIRMVLGETSFIFTGDAEVDSELEMISAGHVLYSDVLHVGHHGSSTSTTQEFFDAVSPSIAVIQLSADNTYGHPHREVRERLAGVTVYRNDEHGDIILMTDGESITVRSATLWRVWLTRFMQWIG